MNSKKVGLSAFSICMYVVAAIILVYFIYSLADLKTQVSNAMAMGQLEGTFKELLNIYVTYTGKYIVFVVVFIAFGFISGQINSLSKRFTNTFDGLDEYDEDEFGAVEGFDGDEFEDDTIEIDGDDVFEDGEAVEESESDTEVAAEASDDVAEEEDDEDAE